MNIETFFDNWSIEENPFRAEEAKDDSIFLKMLEQGKPHPDFEKIYGRPESPSPAVVFGEKGSGKTAIRMQMDHKLQVYNFDHPGDKIWVTHYDDLNPILDRFSHHAGKLANKEVPLDKFRLEDHMDGILSVAVTRLIDLLLGEQVVEALSPRKARWKVRRMNLQKRLDLAEMALLYDHPTNSVLSQRWNRVRRMLRFGTLNWTRFIPAAGLTLLGLGILSSAWIWLKSVTSWPPFIATGLCVTLGVILLNRAVFNHFRFGRLARQIRREVQVMDRNIPALMDMLGQFRYETLLDQPLPLPGDQDSRYQLFARFLRVIEELDYRGMIVLVDRIDEPTRIKGDPDKMRPLIWPLLDNKFLQQANIGVKMLLPIELSHMLRKEGSGFFQRARLDKQHMIEQLQWSGSTLYDLCTRRMNACRKAGVEPIVLSDLFDDDVGETEIAEALDQMHQPRDAFKLVYQVIQEHCLQTSEQDQGKRIPRLTLEHVRRQQSQRVQDLQRGLAPA